MYINDYIVGQKCCRDELGQDLDDTPRIAGAKRSARQYGFEYQAKKRVERATRLVAWGTEIDGDVGVAGAPLDRVLQCQSLTLEALQYTHVTYDIVMGLLGGELSRAFELRVWKSEQVDLIHGHDLMKFSVFCFYRDRILHGRYDYVHLGPPCSTFSIAVTPPVRNRDHSRFGLAGALCEVASEDSSGERSGREVFAYFLTLPGHGDHLHV